MEGYDIFANADVLQNITKYLSFKEVSALGMVNKMLHSTIEYNIRLFSTASGDVVSETESINVQNNWSMVNFSVDSGYLHGDLIATSGDGKFMKLCMHRGHFVTGTPFMIRCVQDGDYVLVYVFFFVNGVIKSLKAAFESDQSPSEILDTFSDSSMKEFIEARFVERNVTENVKLMMTMLYNIYKSPENANLEIFV